jgi:hypothetical protein
VNTGLSLKPGGCVVVLVFNPETLELGPFLWFGGSPGQRLPDLDNYPIAKHTKGDSRGVKLPRKNLRVVPIAAFERASTIAEVAERLFGKLPSTVTEPQRQAGLSSHSSS